MKGVSIDQMAIWANDAIRKNKLNTAFADALPIIVYVIGHLSGLAVDSESLEWVLCKDRMPALPEHSKRVIAIQTVGPAFIGWWDGGVWRAYVQTATNDPVPNVVAWMPLPRILTAAPEYSLSTADAVRVTYDNRMTLVFNGMEDAKQYAIDTKFKITKIELLDVRKYP